MVQLSICLKTINLLFIVTGIIGLFNYVYTRTIGPIKFWQFFLPTFVIWDIFFICFLLPNQTTEGYDGQTWVITLILFAFLFPQYLGIYRYGHNNVSKTKKKT